MSMCTADAQSPETLLEVSPLESFERAACFITFLLRAAPDGEVRLGGSEGDRYHFYLTAPPSAVIRALLESDEFAPVALRSAALGHLVVSLREAEAAHAGREAGVGNTAADAPDPEAAIGAAPSESSAETGAPLPIAGAIERLDSAIGELLQQLATEPAAGRTEEASAVGEADVSAAELEAVFGFPDDAQAETVDPDAVQPSIAEPAVGPVSGEAEAERVLPPEPAGGATEKPPVPSSSASADGEPGAPDATAAAAVPSGETEAGDRRFHIVLGDSCPVCRAVSRISFAADRPPQLPIAGCREPDGCRCSLPDLSDAGAQQGAGGTELHCPACGSGNPSGRSSCDRCGSALVPESANPSAARRRAGGMARAQIQLVAHPFSNFGRLNQFITMIGTLPGVRGVTLRRFRNGILRLAVDYEGQEPLGRHLQAAAAMPLEIVNDGGDLIEIAVSDGGREQAKPAFAPDAARSGGPGQDSA